MDQAEAIMNSVAAIATAAGFTVERDRRFPVGDADMPIALLHTGEEENVILDGAPAHSWASRWEMRPVLEIWLRDTDPAALFSSGRSAWNAVRNATLASPTLLGLLALGQPPRMSVDFVEPDEAADVLVVRVKFELTFER